MTSMQLPSHGIGHSAPSFRQAVDLLNFDRVLHGDLLKQRDFIRHNLEVSNGPLPCPRHIGVSVQGLAAEDNALVGFDQIHQPDIATPERLVNYPTMKTLLLSALAAALFGAGATPAAAFSEKQMEERYCAGMPRQVQYIDRTRADCLDADMAIEVEFTENWYTAIGQSLYYARVEAEKKAGWGKSNRLPNVVPAAIMVCRKRESTCDAHVQRMLDTLTYHSIAIRVWHCKPDIHMTLAECDFADLFGVSE
jgi:hypothetical protein